MSPRLQFSSIDHGVVLTDTRYFYAHLAHDCLCAILKHAVFNAVHGTGCQQFFARLLKVHVSWS